MPSVVVAEGSVAYSVTGPDSGVPVVFVHGSFGGSSVWRRLISRLDPERVRAITLDLPGWGASDAPPGNGPLFQHQAAAVEAVVAKAIGEPVHLVAHSHGATVALVTAMTARIPLRSLTLFEALPLAAIPDREDLLDEMRTFVKEYRAAYESGDRSAARRVIDLWAGPGTFEAISPDAREVVAAGTGLNIREWQSHFEVELPLESFRALSTPTTIVVTERAHRVARAIGESLHGLLPRSSLVEIAGANHTMIHSHAADSAAIVCRAIGLTA